MLTVNQSLGRESLSAGLSSRVDARQLCGSVLAGAPSTARTLVIDLEGETCHFVYAMGSEPVALWDLEVGSFRTTLAALPATVTADEARRLLTAHAHRLVRAARLQTLRGSVTELCTVRRKAASGSHLMRAAAAIITDALRGELAIAD
jgi:hypothetical protein